MFLLMDGIEGWNQMSMNIGPIPGYFWPLHRQFIVRKTAPLQVKKWTQPTAAALKPSPHDKEMVCSSWYILWKHAEIKWLCVPAQHESASSGHYIGNYIDREWNNGPNQKSQHSITKTRTVLQSWYVHSSGWYHRMESNDYVYWPKIRLVMDIT